MKIDGNKAYIGKITSFPLSEYPEFETETSANQLIDFLRDKGDVELYINSEGGEVFEAVQMYNELRRHSRNHNVRVYVDGLSASAASFMMFGGTELIVPNNATIMIHKPTTISWGNADQLRSDADALDTIQSNIESIYLANAKELSGVQIRHMMNQTKWFTGTEFADLFNCKTTDDLPSDKADGNKVLNIFKARMEAVENAHKAEPKGEIKWDLTQKWK